MKIHIFLFVLGLSLLSLVNSQACDLNNKKNDVDFPDITKSIADSYVMGVEYKVPKATQTDYYTEYYEQLFKKGRVESHINGENQIYVYQSETWEAWTITKKNCTLQNITVLANFFKDAQTDWLHFTESGSAKPTTVGPSAMFKIALDAWNNTSIRGKKMAYMGEASGLIRGEKAVYWRRCMPSGGFVDYYFADLAEENAFNSGNLRKFSPLRVSFTGVIPDSPLADQVYDIISFQPFIPKEVEPFQLPKGRNCDRGQLAEGPTLPDFSANSLFLSAEVIYKKFDKENELVSEYYSTLMFALDRETQHLAYYYAPWNSTKKKDDEENKESFLDAPEYVIYDIKHLYKYKISYETAKCEVSRVRSFVPKYKLPENGGTLDLTDPYVLFPNSDLKFLTEGKDRGLKVNIYETEVKRYNLDKDTTIPRAIVSQSYLKFNEESENTVAVRNAPTQIELHFFRNNQEEVLTLNIYGFTTRIPGRRYLFDVTRCYKNDDDYLFLTIGFEIENQYLPQIEKALPDIEKNVISQVTLHSELNAVRIPTVLTDLKENYVYVTMIILGNPTLQLEFPDREEDKKIKTSNPDDIQAVSDFDTCAKNCLEERDNCWGFSMCGATCSYGSTTNTVVEVKKNCTLYRRYINETFIFSKEKQADVIVREVETGQFNIMAVLGDQKRVTLTATVADITNPAEDDSLFEKMGNFLNPRMQVFKAGSKLKKGTTVKNLGKLRYDECQNLCLDFKNCESLSYCLLDSQCVVSNKFGNDLTVDEKEDDDFCVLLTRKYADNFDRTPGVFVENGGGIKKNIDTVEDCARACLKENSIKCLSFDHCAGEENKGCYLYTVHYLNPKDRKTSVKGKNPRCGHYSRKYSTEFKKKDTTVTIGSKVPPLTNLTLEECAKTCVEYGAGTCYGYDFCQDKTLYSTSCTILDSDPSQMEKSYSPICTSYMNSVSAKESEAGPRPYTNSYAGGIGFLCFLVGGLIGAVVVFVIAYIKANRG